MSKLAILGGEKIATSSIAANVKWPIVNKAMEDGVLSVLRDGNMSGTNISRQFEEKFDGVLCDVPCSGFGTVSENPDIKLFRKQEDFNSLFPTQLGILTTCSRYVKKGGALYYSTCSIFEEENDRVVQQFLKENNGFEVEKLTSPLAHDTKKFGLQFLPDTAFGAGFYVCKLRRL